MFKNRTEQISKVPLPNYCSVIALEHLRRSVVTLQLNMFLIMLLETTVMSVTSLRMLLTKKVLFLYSILPGVWPPSLASDVNVLVTPHLVMTSGIAVD